MSNLRNDNGQKKAFGSPNDEDLSGAKSESRGESEVCVLQVLSLSETI